MPGVTRQGSLYRNRERRRLAQDLTAFAALIASPTDLGSAAADASLTGVKLPANHRLAISIDAETSAGDITVTVGSRTLGIAGGPANSKFPLGWLERSETVSVNRDAAGPSGDVTLHLVDEWGRFHPIATGTFS